MGSLSIHVDESGDFGEYSPKYAPHYVFAMVFHEQDDDIGGDIRALDRELANLGCFGHVIHTGPLVRREEAYCNLSPNERRAIFTKLFYFTKKVAVSYRIFYVDRKECRDGDALRSRIRALLSAFLDENLEYFLSFDRVVLYYDNGRARLARELREVFSEKVPSFERKPDASPRKYRLMQAADMLCTLRLLEIKAKEFG